MDGCRASSSRRLYPRLDMRRRQRVTPAVFIEACSRSFPRQTAAATSVSPLTEAGTIEAIVLIAREHRGGVRSGTGAIEADGMVTAIARGVVASDGEQLLDHRRAVVAASPVFRV